MHTEKSSQDTMLKLSHQITRGEKKREKKETPTENNSRTINKIAKKEHIH